MTNYLINLREAIYSLSDALDLVGVTHIHHGKRVAFMAAECAKHLGWSKEQIDDLFQSAILHDSGVSKTAVHAKLAQLQWEEESEHCVLGAQLMRSSPLLEKFAPVIQYHHTHWKELDGMDLPEAVKLNANCIYMVDRVDILTLKHLADGKDILLGKEKIRETINSKRGDWFHPELVDAFLEVSRSEAFWFSLERDSIDGYVATWLDDTWPEMMNFDALRSLVSVFSYIVDAKSEFTSQHSEGVARLARFLGEQASLSKESCEMIELAGLLHDIGKLRIPDDLLEKPGKLSDTEVILMRRHSFDTYNILKKISGLEQVTKWAAQHHERVDGSGYPYHLKKDELAIEARIIEVADVFQALAQRRPYRDSLPPEQILSMLKQQVDSGKLDGDVVALVENNLEASWKAAMRKDD
ncbi:MAG: HD domain-containing phosphohydrolase [Pseudomonadota bacterium]